MSPTNHAAIIDRSPQRQKLDTDLQTVTTSAWQTGVELPDIVWRYSNAPTNCQHSPRMPEST